MALINEYLNASAAKINIPTPFILKGQAPLDLRQIVQKKEDLILANFYDGDAPFWYPGMLVSCVEDSKVYILKEKVEVDEATQEEVKSYEFVEVTPDLPENATKNTTYDLASVQNTDKGQIQLSNSDDTSVDTVSIEGDGSNIKVSSTAAGVKVEHIVPTKGDALTASATTKDPGYAGTFTAVTGLTKDANGHIVAATLETIKMPGTQDLSGYKTKQTAVTDATASGVATTAVTSVTQNENGEITVTKANLPSVTDTAIAGQYVTSVTQANGQIAVTRAALPSIVNSLDGVSGEITTLKNQTDTGKINLSVDNNGQLKAELVGTFADDADVNVLEGVKVNDSALTIADKSVNWDLHYDSRTKKLQIRDLNNNNTAVSEVDATDFIKDGLLSGGELVWCVITEDEQGNKVHTEATEDTKGAVHCLKLTLRVLERGQVDAEGKPVYNEQYVHIPLGELCDPYSGTAGEINVVEDHGAHVISLATKTVSETTGEALTPAHGGSFNVVTDVTYDTKGRIAGVETTQVTLPECAEIGDGTQTGSDDYVSVTVSTADGVVSGVTVNTDTLTTKISNIETEISENAQVTAASLNDLNEQIHNLVTGVSSVKANTSSSHVTVTPTTDATGAVEVTVNVASVDASDSYTGEDATGLATDAYVKEMMSWAVFS